MARSGAALQASLSDAEDVPGADALHHAASRCETAAADLAEAAKKLAGLSQQIGEKFQPPPRNSKSYSSPRDGDPQVLPSKVKKSVAEQKWLENIEEDRRRKQMRHAEGSQHVESQESAFRDGPVSKYLAKARENVTQKTLDEDRRPKSEVQKPKVSLIEEDGGSSSASNASGVEDASPSRFCNSAILSALLPLSQQVEEKPNPRLEGNDKRSDEGKHEQPTLPPPLADPEDHASNVMSLEDFLQGVGDLHEMDQERASAIDRSPQVDIGSVGLRLLLPDYFEQPCETLGVSGGTAPFYKVQYKRGMAPGGEGFEGRFIGKDLAHAADEVEFYIEISREAEGSECWERITKCCMECPGVVDLLCKINKGGPNVHSNLCNKKLLLLGNLYFGFKRLRLCDVKIGEQTAVGGWKGKSHLRALKNQQIDKRTNSAVEGFRLEGMDNKPVALAARLDMIADGFIQTSKQARRFALQQLCAADFLEDWLDVSDLGPEAERHATAAALGGVESLAELFRGLRDIPVPQQWIGSSVSLGVEVGQVDMKPKVSVKCFDWGRSELNLADKHAHLSSPARRERVKYWRMYMSGFLRLLWEISRVAAHRCACPMWCGLCFELRDEAVGYASPHGMIRAMGLLELPDGELHVGHWQLYTDKAQASSGSKVSSFESSSSRASSRNCGKSPPAQRSPLRSTLVPSPTMELELPLIGRTATDKTSQAIAALHLSVTSPPGGEGTLAVMIHDLHSPMLCGKHAPHVTLRVVAFQEVSDARSHMDAWASNKPEPIPRGRTYPRTAPPGLGNDGVVVWSQRLEFAAVGHSASAAVERRLALAMGTSLNRRGSRVDPDTGREQATLWPWLLPPRVGIASEKATIEAFERYRAEVLPWIVNDGALPRTWL
eukprot:gnl/MRDRNA2_/MRDRNA2_78934_c0_seq1.p1 gnl/MRDRNA2_/MRDRNA2_78934_c0~~gnl/MRDRNA2_/MRDRNA2_78934_c0_seq1.p1  ORF type:complete len:953 (+),score=180.62 gnl/MRDRNA2_/MRDRNA2_78934_c0_seq1:190-2859(+)